MSVGVLAVCLVCVRLRRDGVVYFEWRCGGGCAVIIGVVVFEWVVLVGCVVTVVGVLIARVSDNVVCGCGCG